MPLFTNLLDFAINFLSKISAVFFNTCRHKTLIKQMTHYRRAGILLHVNTLTGIRKNITKLDTAPPPPPDK